MNRWLPFLAVVALMVFCCCVGFVLWQLQLPDCWMGC